MEKKTFPTTSLKDADKLPKVLCGTAFSAVLWATKSFYDNGGNPQECHFLSLTEVKEMLYKLYPKLTHLIVAHEHGELNGRCHYQIGYKKTTSMRAKAFIEFADGAYGLVSQTARSYSSVVTYCKKDGDYIEEGDLSSVALKKSEVYTELYYKLTKGEITNENDAVNYLVDNGEAMNCFINMNKMKSFITSLMIGVPVVPKYEFPSHLDDLLGRDPSFSSVHTSLRIWFDNFCCMGRPEYRKLGLLLYSPMREIGKTYTAERFSLNPSKTLKVRIEPIAETFVDPHLIIFDDVSPDWYTKNANSIELIKALASGDTCSISSKYQLKEFCNKGVPFIVTTNSSEVFRLFGQNTQLRESFFRVELMTKIVSTTEPRLYDKYKMHMYSSY